MSETGAKLAEIRSRGWTIFDRVHDVARLRACVYERGGSGLNSQLSVEECAELVHHPVVTAVLDALYESWYSAIRFDGLNGRFTGWHFDSAERSPLLLAHQPAMARPEALHAMWALDDFTAENGPTEVREASGDLVRAIMPAGSCLVFIASRLKHRAGPQRKDKPRAFFFAQYRGNRRQPDAELLAALR